MFDLQSVDAWKVVISKRSIPLSICVLHIARAKQPHGAAPVTVRYQHGHRWLSLYRRFQSTAVE